MITRCLFNVSFPRSGHHFIEDALRGYFGDRFVYCGHYDHCNATPCTHAATNFQKNHDLWLDTPTLAGERYLILLRHPYPALQSYFDLYLEQGWLPVELDTRETWRQWLGSGLRYWLRFVDRWVLNGPDGRYVLSYEDMTADPIGRMAEIVELMAPDRAIDHGHLADALARSSAIRHMPGMGTGRCGARPFAARKIERFRYYDPAELADVNACLARLPKGAVDIEKMVRAPLPGRPITLAAGAHAAPRYAPPNPSTVFAVLPGWEAVRNFLATTAKIRPGLRVTVDKRTANHLLPVIMLPAGLIDATVRDYVGLLGGRIVPNDDQAARQAAHG